MGVSRFPVSEAFARLQAEGLVEILPQRRSLVSRVRLADVVENMLIRKALESEAFARYRAGPAGVVDKLKAIWSSRARPPGAADRETFHLHDMDFHDILFEAMRFGRIRSIIDSARQSRSSTAPILDPAGSPRPIPKHTRHRRGNRRGDADRATAAMRRHIDKGHRRTARLCATAPELFADANNSPTSPRFSIEATMLKGIPPILNTNCFRCCAPWGTATRLPSSTQFPAEALARR